VAPGRRSGDRARIGGAKIGAKHGRRQNKEADANRRKSRSSQCKCAALGKDFCTHVRPLRLSMCITEKTTGMVPMRRGHDFAWWQVILLLHPASANRMIRKRERYLSLKAYGDVSGHNCRWCAGGTGPVWRRALGVEVRQALRLVSLVIARAATGDLVTVKGRLC
jgi:hypothetical protein